MFVVLGMAALPPARADERAGLSDALAKAALAVPGLRSFWAAPVCERSVIDAGDVVWRAVFAGEAQALALHDGAAWHERFAPLLDGLEVVRLGYELGDHAVQPGGPGIWRALIFRCFATADPAIVAQLAEATLLLPRAVPEIRSWALSRATWTERSEPFDWVWEQEFSRLEDLTGPYMSAPVHWGLVDAYFDADCPEYVVDPRLVQVIGAIHRTIME